MNEAIYVGNVIRYPFKVKKNGTELAFDNANLTDIKITVYSKYDSSKILQRFSKIGNVEGHTTLTALSFAVTPTSEFENDVLMVEFQVTFLDTNYPNNADVKSGTVELGTVKERFNG